MTEQPVNLPTAIYLGVFSRAEQRVLQAIFRAIAEGGGRCVATLAMLARNSNTSKATTRNAINQAVAIGLLEKTERRSYCAVSLPQHSDLREALICSGSDEQIFGADQQAIRLSFDIWTSTALSNRLRALEPRGTLTKCGGEGT